MSDFNVFVDLYLIGYLFNKYLLGISVCFKAI